MQVTGRGRGTDAQPHVGVVPEQLAIVLRIDAAGTGKHNGSRCELRCRAGAAVAHGQRAGHRVLVAERDASPGWFRTIVEQYVAGTDVGSADGQPAERRSAGGGIDHVAIGIGAEPGATVVEGNGSTVPCCRGDGAGNRQAV